jgi:hypothetical protein
MPKWSIRQWKLLTWWWSFVWHGIFWQWGQLSGAFGTVKALCSGHNQTILFACITIVLVEEKQINTIWAKNITYTGLRQKAEHWEVMFVVGHNTLPSGLWSWYTKPPTPTSEFLNLWLQLLHESSVCINNGKPTKTVYGIIRQFITTTWIIRLLLRLITYI